MTSRLVVLAAEDRRRLASNGAVLGLLAIVGGGVVTYSAKMAVVLAVMGAVALTFFVVRDRLLLFVGLAVVAAWLAVPATVPRGFPLGSKTIFFADLLLPAAAIAVRVRFRSFKVEREVLILTVIFGIEAVHGFLAGASSHLVVEEVRGPVYLISAFVIASRLAYGGYERKLIATIGWTLGISAIVIATAAASGSALSGRDETVAATSGYAVNATRFLTPATHLALAALCVAVVYAVLSRPTWTISLIIAASGLITFLGFSRNSLLALGTALCFAVLVRANLRTVVRLSLALVVASSALVFTFISASVSAPGFANAQMNAYKVRVLDGLSGTARAQDSSATWRNIENSYAQHSFRTAPVFGHGLGTMYRPPLGPATSFEGYGRYYIHSGYWWLAVKTGVVGIIGFILFIALARRRFSRADPYSIALLASLVGLLAITVVVPMPVDPGGAPALGMLVGLLSVAARHQDRALEQG
jgi:hypothetical protein